MALMTDDDIEKEINARFTAILLNDDWVLIPNDKLLDIKRIVKRINR